MKSVEQRDSTTDSNHPFLYDAVISYSMTWDGELCGALRNGLVKFAKPFWKLRALRIYRDVESGTGSPDIREGLRKAFRAARFFILLARPESTTAPYVCWELDQWIDGVLERGDAPGKFLVIVRSGGRIGFDKSTGAVDWSATDCLPDTLDHPWRDAANAPRRLSEILGSITPRVEDMTWAGSKAARSTRSKDFQEALAAISSPIRGVPKDDLFSEEIERRRQTVQTLWAVATTLLVLLITAAWQWKRAERERRAAEVMTWIERGARAQLLAATTETQAEAIAVGIDAVAPALEQGVTPPDEAINGLDAALRGYRQSFAISISRQPILRGDILLGDRAAVVGCRGGPLYSFDLEHGHLLAANERSDGIGDYLLVAAVADGRAIVAARSGGDIVEWLDSTTLAISRTWHCQAGESILVAKCDPARRRVAIGTDRGRVALVSTDVGAEVSSYSDTPAGAALEWSPDSREILCLGYEGVLSLLDLESATTKKLTPPPGAPSCVKFLKDRRIAVAVEGADGNEYSIHVASLDSQVGWNRLGATPQRVTRMASSADGSWLACWGFQRCVTLWSLADWSLSGPSPKPISLCHPHDVERVAFALTSPLILCGLSNGQVMAWDRRSGQPVSNMPATTDSVEWLAFDSEGRRFVAAGFDGRVRISDLKPRDAAKPWIGHSARVSALTSLENGWVTASWDAKVVSYDPQLGPNTLAQLTDGVIQLVASQDHRGLVALTFRGEVWCGPTNGAAGFRLDAHLAKAIAGTFACGDRVVVTGGGDGVVRRFRVSDGSDLGELGRGLGSIRCLATVGTGNLVVGGGEAGIAHVWDATDRRKLVEFHSQGGPVLDVCSRPGSEHVVSTGASHALLWNARTGEVVRELPSASASTDDADVSRSGDLAAIARSDRTVDLWDLERGTRIATLGSGGSPVNAVRFSRDGDLLAVACDQGEVAVYRASNGKPLVLFQTGESAGIWAVDFSFDGRSVLAGDEGGRVFEFSLEPADLLRTAREYLQPRSLK